MPKRTGRPPGLKTDGPEIRRLRVEHGLTRVELAAQLGLNEESIRRAERGGPLGDVTTSRLARALGVHMRDISNWAGGDDTGSAPQPKALAS